MRDPHAKERVGVFVSSAVRVSVRVQSANAIRPRHLLRNIGSRSCLARATPSVIGQRRRAQQPT